MAARAGTQPPGIAWGRRFQMGRAGPLGALDRHLQCGHSAWAKVSCRSRVQAPMTSISDLSWRWLSNGTQEVFEMRVFRPEPLVRIVASSRPRHRG